MKIKWFEILVLIAIIVVSMKFSAQKSQLLKQDTLAQNEELVAARAYEGFLPGEPITNDVLQGQINGIKGKIDEISKDTKAIRVEVLDQWLTISNVAGVVSVLSILGPRIMALLALARNSRLWKKIKDCIKKTK